ncbi:hypothetical protein VTI74DRAFT_3003 [Chaetomium olivicolor]
MSATSSSSAVFLPSEVSVHRLTRSQWTRRTCLGYRRSRSIPQSRSGTVLKSADPRDTLEINFHLFEENSKGTELDLNAELDTVKWARRVFAEVPPPWDPLRLLSHPARGLRRRTGPAMTRRTRSGSKPKSLVIIQQAPATLAPTTILWPC